MWAPQLVFLLQPTKMVQQTIADGPPNIPRLGVVLDRAPRVKCLVSSIEAHYDVEWHLVSHEAVGGVTTCLSRLLSLSVPRFTVPSGVSRTIGSIISYKHFVPACEKEAEGLTTADRLPVGQPTASIKIPCRHSPTGFGSRSLTISELCLAWDFPLWVTLPPGRHSLGLLSSMVPLKILLAAADVLLEGMDLVSAPSGSSPLPELARPVRDPHGDLLAAAGSMASSFMDG